MLIVGNPLCCRVSESLRIVSEVYRAFVCHSYGQVMHLVLHPKHEPPAVETRLVLVLAKMVRTLKLAPLRKGPA